jgi:hypothetical protein
MLRIVSSMGLLLSVVLVFGLAGCNSKAPDSSSNSPVEPSTSGHDDHAHGEHADHGNGGQSANLLEGKLTGINREPYSVPDEAGALWIKRVAAAEQPTRIVSATPTGKASIASSKKSSWTRTRRSC